jgi:carboxypeptidase Q
VIAFAAEEIGLIGARAYKARHANSVANHLIGGESDFGFDEPPLAPEETP